MGQTQYPQVVLETNYGNITLKLYDDTPIHSENFIKLVNEGYYDGLLFHRVINNFMIQTGDPNSRNAQAGAMLGSGGPGYTLPAEFVPTYYHKRGALAAARQPDQINPQKESSGSQFYIVQGRRFSTQELNTMVQRGMHVPFTEEQIKQYVTEGGSPHLDYEYTVFGEMTRGFEVLNEIAKQPVDKNSRPINDVVIKKAYTVK
jgi:peptidyl-prolyl cis-trans isomerase B (cyclophilin B)